MDYPLVYNKELGVPFALGKIREQSFYKLVTNRNDSAVFLFFINTIMDCSVEGYYTYVSKERSDDILEKAYSVINDFMTETKGSRRDITIYKDNALKERNVFVYISLSDIEGEFHLCQTYLRESPFLHQPILPRKRGKKDELSISLQ